MIMVNSITFRLADGRLICLDRDETEFRFNKDGTFAMQWNSVYVWDGNNEIYLTESDERLFNGAAIFRIDIEDEAPRDYQLIIKQWNI